MNKTKFTPNLIKELKSFLVERYVDNMSDVEFIDEVLENAIQLLEESV